jgi:hypothetical protein
MFPPILIREWFDTAGGATQSFEGGGGGDEHPAERSSADRQKHGRTRP